MAYQGIIIIETCSIIKNYIIYILGKVISGFYSYKLFIIFSVYYIPIYGQTLKKVMLYLNSSFRK